MKLLVFGHSGQVATELRRQGGPEVIALDRAAADLTDPSTCEAAIDACDAEAVINAAAFTAVDRAEAEEAVALKVNGETPGAMARACAARGLPFLHVSTDYVFSGSGSGSWDPADPVEPLNAYGRTKLAGEEAVRAAGGRHIILRTSWVFSAHGANFVKTMLRLADSRDSLSVVDDQIGGPTPAADIAAALLVMAQAMTSGHEGGTYHFAGSPPVSWAGFARETFTQAGRHVAVTGIPTTEYPTPAARPLNSRLDCAKTHQDFDIAAPDWKSGLAAVLKELNV